MLWKFDPRLLEEAVFHTLETHEGGAKGDFTRRLRRGREACYALEGEAREAAFQALHEQLFRDLGLTQLFTELLQEQPLFATTLDEVGVIACDSDRSVGAELYVARVSGRRHAILRVVPAGLRRDNVELRARLRAELQHIADMLTPRFAYEPTLRLAGPGTAATLQLLRDRYAVLWELSIAGRLARRHSGMALPKPRFAPLLARLFPSFTAEAREALLDAVWSNDEPTHAGLVAQARGSLAARSQAEPGAACPRCEFPSFDWVEGTDGPCCRQCHEMLAVAAIPHT